jgi:putative glutamine amidotransferase
VLKAGGIPVPLLGIEEAIPDLVKQLDGFVLTGGDDVHPRFYKERPLAEAKLRLASDRRVKFDMKLFRGVVHARKPVLAICYGAQLVNVALGGTLYQDIGLQVPDAKKHGAARPGDKVFHPVSVFEGTKLCKVLDLGACCRSGTCSIKVRSAHHQSVKNPGKGLRLAAVSPDGVYEALEARGKTFLVAVQWHPEKMPADRNTGKLFSALINASRR